MVLDYAKSLQVNVSSGVGLLISGPPGVGKSYAMAALTRYYMERLRPGRLPSVVYHTIYEVNDRYAPVVGNSPFDDERGQSWTKTYETCKWLVLNDLGKEYRGGKYAEQMAYKVGRLLRARSERALVTHVTTNLPLASSTVSTFSTTYGDSIWSLTAEMMQRYEVDGPDRREGHG